MSVLSAENFTPSQAIITGLCGELGTVCIETPAGNLLWQAPEISVDALQLERELALQDEQQDTFAVCKIYWQPGADQSNVIALEQLCHYWQKEHTSERELDSMAVELSERYEELNLLYKPKEKDNKTRSDIEYIQSLLTECVSRLQLDNAVAMQTDFGLFCASQAQGVQPVANEREYTSELRQASTAYTDAQGAVIINVPNPNNKPSPVPGFHCIFTPIQPSPGNTLGGLWFFKKSDKQKFLNSDSRIATNIASEITGSLIKHHDTTTGLLNRRGFEKSLQSTLDMGLDENPGVVAYINIQRFSIVNDHGGYAAGDFLLKHFSALLNEFFRETDIVARLVADEFVVLLKNCNCDQAIERLKAFIELAGTNPFVWEEQAFPLSLSIGLTPLVSHNTANACIKEADAACDLATQAGANQIKVFDGKDLQYQRYASDRQLIPLLHNALADDLFELYAQPIVAINADSTELSHAEVLVRLRDKDGEMLSPAVFVPVAENFGLMSDIDMWIVEHALRALADWQTKHPTVSAKLSINLSGRTLTNDYANVLIKLLNQHDVAPEQVCFEITETAALIDMDTAVSIIKRLKDQGCSFALDDFGAGLSSFSYLQNMPVDYLKIDGSFVKNITQDDVSKTFVDGINSIGHAMGLKTIAEFVSDQDILDTLSSLNVDYAQGYHTGKPMPIAEYFSLLAAAKQKN